VKKAHIEAGVTRSVEKVEAVSIIEILLRVSAMDSHQPGWFPKISRATGSQGAHPPGEGASEDAGTFVASTKNTRYSVSSSQ